MIVADARGDTKQTNGAADVTGVWSFAGPTLTLNGDISDGAPAALGPPATSCAQCLHAPATAARSASCGSPAAAAPCSQPL